jgi:16S rRNA (guanine966-N2)-methyltransferase
MRIVAGKHRGRRLIAPEGLAVRPTADRTREALFSILARGRGGPAPLAGARVLDAFAGTGALGLEALSHGAGSVAFMESQPSALAALERNIEALGEGAHAQVLSADVLRPPRTEAPAGIVLMDPPYSQGLAEPALTALAEAGWIAAETLVVVELMAKEPFAIPPGFAVSDERKYGQARLVFLRRSQPG